MLENLKETAEILVFLNEYKRNTLLSRSDLVALKKIIDDYRENEKSVEDVLKKLKQEKKGEKVFELLHDLRLACLNYTEDINNITNMIKKVSDYYD